MPEEINRILTDEISNLCFVTEESGRKNLLSEGKKAENIHFVGNTMIDTLVHFDDEIMQSEVLETLGLEAGQFGLMTMHRPRNVDNHMSLQKLVGLIAGICAQVKLVFPMHPRTKKALAEAQLIRTLEQEGRLVISEPLGYFDFQRLIVGSSFVITDSGGIQEETTFRRRPCITLRPSTERPSTVEIGSNTLANFNLDEVLGLIDEIKRGTYKLGKVPDLWDGHATERVFKVLSQLP